MLIFHEIAAHEYSATVCERERGHLGCASVSQPSAPKNLSRQWLTLGFSNGLLPDGKPQVAFGTDCRNWRCRCATPAIPARCDVGLPAQAPPQTQARCSSGWRAFFVFAVHWPGVSVRRHCNCNGHACRSRLNISIAWRVLRKTSSFVRTWSFSSEGSRRPRRMLSERRSGNCSSKSARKRSPQVYHAVKLMTLSQALTTLSVGLR